MKLVQPSLTERCLPHLCQNAAKLGKGWLKTPAFFVKTSRSRLLFLDLQGFWVAAGLMKLILCLAYRFESFRTIERGGNMNKNELVSAVAEKAGLTKADAASAVDAVFDVVQAELKKKGDIRLAGFGSFTVSHRAATKGRNPSTGAEVNIPARNVPKFTPGKGLKDAVNG